MSFKVRSDHTRLKGLYAVPGGFALLEWLADFLITTTNSETMTALSDWTIFLPNQRATKALQQALLASTKHDALILPNFITLAHLDKNAALRLGAWSVTDLPHVISRPAQIGALTQWLIAYFEARDLPIQPANILVMAEKLHTLINDADNQTEIDWSILPSLADDPNLASHWQESVTFLNIVAKSWPAYLAETNTLSQSQIRLAIVKELSAYWQNHPAQKPVIIVGSIGTNMSTRHLMKAVLTLPHGSVILPEKLPQWGCDALKKLRDSPTHPHATLAGTVQWLERPVQSLPVPSPAYLSTACKARRSFLHASFCPIHAMADWHHTPTEVRLRQKEGARGLCFVPADTPADEALNIAIIMRNLIEQPQGITHLITPDAALAKQVQAHLLSMGIAVPLSQGSAPLAEPTIQFWILLTRLLTDPGDQILLAEFLHHPFFAHLHEDIQIFDRYMLRTPRNWSDLDSLENAIGDMLGTTNIRKRLSPSEADACWRVVTLLRTAIPKTTTQLSIKKLEELGTKLVSPDILWSSETSQSTRDWLNAIETQTAYFPDLTPHDLSRILESEAKNLRLVDTTPEHPRLRILGALEARLLSADTVILGGLVEGKWPTNPPVDSFLPPHFRTKLGFADPQTSIGLAARDVFTLLQTPKVYLSWSARSGETSLVSSSWVQRIHAYAEALGLDPSKDMADSVSRALPLWSKAYKQTKITAQLAAPPAPKPPTNIRPTTLSVSGVEQLLNDPYAYFARNILKLKPLSPIAPEIGAHDIGSVLHEQLEMFIREHRGMQDYPDFKAELTTRLTYLGASPTDILRFFGRREQSLIQFLNWHKNYANKTASTTSIAVEVSMQTECTIGSLTFTIKGKADRIHTNNTGFEVIDYKTGALPSDSQIASGLKPQLPLLAMIYEDVTQKQAHQLTYLRFVSPWKAEAIKNAQQKIDTIRANLPTLLAIYASSEQAFMPADKTRRQYPNPDFTTLSRRGEWSGQYASDLNSDNEE